MCQRKSPTLRPVRQVHVVLLVLLQALNIVSQILLLPVIGRHGSIALVLRPADHQGRLPIFGPLFFYGCPGAIAPKVRIFIDCPLDVGNVARALL